MEKKKNFEYSPELYDMQVNWSARFAKEKSFFEKLISGRSIKRILDIGCGTGHHVQLFSEIIAARKSKTGNTLETGDANSKGGPGGTGTDAYQTNAQSMGRHSIDKHTKDAYAGDVAIIGMDPDENMIRFARQKIVTAKNVKLIVGGFEDLENIADGQFEFITCLGNTLTLLGDRRKVKSALKSTRKKLVRGGLAIFQFLNFEPKMIEKERYYKPKTFKKDEYKYITLKHFEYGKFKTLADFIKIQIDASDNIVSFDNHTSYMCTLRKNMFIKMARNAGFKKIELLAPGGEKEFDKNSHISLNALLYN